MRTMPKLELHPYCELLPVMPEDQFRELAASIRDHGLRDPIVVDMQNRIVDGRHRYRACVETGVIAKFVTTELEGVELIDWILDTNVCRRHLEASQRAMISQRFIAEYRKARELAGRKIAEHEITREVAEKTGVAQRTLARADFVARNDEALATEVRDGRKSLHAAEQEIRTRSAETSQLLPIGRSLNSPDSNEPPRTEIKDAVGTVVPEHLLEVFIGGKERSEDIRRRITQISDELLKANDLDCGIAGANLREFCKQIRLGVPALVCSKCGGDGHVEDGPNAHRGCTWCASRGWLPLHQHKAEKRAEVTA